MLSAPGFHVWGLLSAMVPSEAIGMGDPIEQGAWAIGPTVVPSSLTHSEFCGFCKPEGTDPFPLQGRFAE